MRLVSLVVGLSACNMDFQVTGMDEAASGAYDTADEAAYADDRRERDDDTDAPARDEDTDGEGCRRPRP